MPSWKEFFVAIGQLLKFVGVWVVTAARRHSGALLASAIVVLAVMTAWSWYLQWRTTEFVVLVGPGGGGSINHAKRIGRKIADQSSPYGAAYAVRIESTDGSEDIRKQISEDRDGNLIGFAHDGFGNSENVRILLPLDKNYLFVLCRKQFSEQTLKKSPGSKVTFADVMKNKDLLKPGRVFLGPTGSGTRQLAELVTERFDLDPQKYQTNGVYDWNDMRAALNNGYIDIAFYSGPLDADVVQEIAKDGSSVLVGLDGDRDPILQGRIHVFPAKLTARSFAAGDFCPRPLETIASRRVLICPADMPEETAYFLAKHAHMAMRSMIQDIDWNNPLPESPRTEGFTYQLHPGAERLKQNNPPGPLPWNNNYVLLTLALWLATELATSINRKFQQSQADKPPQVANQEGGGAGSGPTAAAATGNAPNPTLDALPQEAFTTLEREIYGQLFEDFLALPAIPSRSQRAAWKKHTAQLRERVLHEFQNARISERDSEAFLAALDKVADALNRRQSKKGSRETPSLPKR